jgi:transcriptional regulator NrdR family protein
MLTVRFIRNAMTYRTFTKIKKFIYSVYLPLLNIIKSSHNRLVFNELTLLAPLLFSFQEVQK